LIKKLISGILALSLLLCIAPIAVKASRELSLSANSAIMIEADSNNILFEKNADVPLPMASTTKIMTAITVIEACEPNKKFTVSELAVGTEGTSAYLQKEDTITIEDALYALLLQSANDVAVALAIECAGSVEGFVELMNKKASDLHLSKTSFKNPSGLPDQDHYTTAKDLAVLSSYCMKNHTFSKIVSSKQATVKINNQDRTFVNHNKLLSLYDGAIGIKTGYTKESGRCLVGAAQKNGVSVITVTLDASDDWSDHKKMFDHAFESYRSYTLYSQGSFIVELPVAGKTEHIKLFAPGEKKAVLKKGAKITVRIEAPSLLTSPIKKGDAFAFAIFEHEGKELFRTELCALNDLT